MSKEKKPTYYVNEMYEVVDEGGYWKWVLKEVDDGAIVIRYADWDEDTKKWKFANSETIIHGTPFIRKISELMLSMCDSIDKRDKPAKDEAMARLERQKQLLVDSLIATGVSEGLVEKMLLSVP